MTSIPVNAPLLDGNERKYLNECIDTGWISSEGPFVERFEKDFAQRCQRKHGIAVCNGSAALDLAVSALGIGPGDEVIMPTFTIISCASAVIRAGALPVLVDCDLKTWNMNVQSVEKRITPRTKAIMLVHIYGLPVDVDPILDLAKKNGLSVIEDAAEMHGQTYKQRPCGSFGDVSTFSFYPNKLVTTGEGGMLMTNDDRLAEKIKARRNLCFQPQARFMHEELGWNFRMSNLQAALGVSQLERLDEFIDKKRHIGALYRKHLSGLSTIETQPESMPYANNIYWVFGVVLKDTVSFNAKEAMCRLSQKGIGTRPFFFPMHEQPVFKKIGMFANESYPVAERLARRGFYLPSGLALTDEQVEQSSAALREVLA